MEKYIITLPEEIRSLIPDFMQNRKKELEWLQNALLKEDYEKIIGIAHASKGVLGSFGFTKAYRIAEKTESYARMKNKKGVEKSVSDLSFNLNQTEIHYKDDLG